MKPDRAAILAVLMAGLGIILGNTLADFTQDAESDILGGGNVPSITFTCTPNQ